MFKRVDHVEIITGNIDGSLDFYTNVLGFKLKERKKMSRPPLEEIVYVELGDTVVEFLAVANPAPVSNEPWQIKYRMMALEVEDMDRAIDYLKSKGVEPSVPPVSLGESKRAEIKDNNGSSIELRQW